jgi:DNA polymerase-1
MEFVGIKIDVDYLNELSQDFSKEIFALESGIYEECGEEFNINSPKQLARILFEVKNLPVVEKLKQGILLLSMFLKF